MYETLRLLIGFAVVAYIFTSIASHRRRVKELESQVTRLKASVVRLINVVAEMNRGR